MRLYPNSMSLSEEAEYAASRPDFYNTIKAFKDAVKRYTKTLKDTIKEGV